MVALLMLGTPNRGTEIARAAKTLGSAAGRNMRPFDDDLAELNREWAASVVNGGDPDRDPDRRTALLCRAVVGSQDFVVPAASATALSSFASIETLNKGHIDLAKAAHRDDSTYVAVSRFLHDANEASKSRLADAAVRRLTHRLRQASLANRWVRREEEHIELEETEHTNRLLCKLRNVREGALASRGFTFAIFASDYRPTGRTIDFDWELGRGTLGDEEYSRLTETAQVKLESYLRISKLQIRQAGREGAYTLERTEQSLGQSLLEFRAPEWVREGEPFERFEIAFESFVDFRQGWYHYYIPRTVTDGLLVTFKAPFPYGVVTRLGKGTRRTGPSKIADSYCFRAVVEAPVAIGRSVTWIYRG